MQIQEFEALGRLAATIPLRQVTPSADLAYFLRLGEIILEDFQAIPPFTTPPARTGSR